MTRYIAALTLVLMLGMAAIRLVSMKAAGIEAFKFGKTDKTDFLIPPFVLAYFYLVFALAFQWPAVNLPTLLPFKAVPWFGVVFCLAGLLVFLWSLVSFGRSFRVGIDTDRPDRLIATGAFGWSRNPIYVAFTCILLGQFLIASNWIFLGYLVAGIWLLHRQILREEAFLKSHYGHEYSVYCQRVRRYL